VQTRLLPLQSQLSTTFPVPLVQVPSLFVVYPEGHTHALIAALYICAPLHESWPEGGVDVGFGVEVGAGGGGAMGALTTLHLLAFVSAGMFNGHCLQDCEG
jgi:hypothetical protein